MHGANGCGHWGWSVGSDVLLPCAYDIYYDYAVLLLISLLLHAPALCI